MQFVKRIKLSVGYLAIWGVPLCLVYSGHNLASGKEGHSLWLFGFSGFLSLLLFFWLFTLKGEQYIDLKPLWERPLALLLLMLSFPLLFIAGLAIKLESPGPAVYRQKRVSMNGRKRERRQANSGGGVGKERRNGDRRKIDIGGRPFVIYKLRSMRKDAEHEIGAAWSTGDHDPRITRIGYYIRKTHLDELPQLLNVILGHMSLIGPRPERPDFIVQLAETIEGYRDRLNVQPGITGLSQVRKEADQSVDDVKEKLKNDREYIRNICLPLDIKIVLKTAILMTNLIWSAIRRRTIEKIEPKPADILFAENSRTDR